MPIMQHPAVAQVVTFAIAHPTLGEDVAAAVVLLENTSAAEKEIREFAFLTLADFKVPSQVLIVDEIPKGPSGKLQRNGLVEKIAHKLKTEFIAPEDPVEQNLAEIWTEVLGIEKIGINDNFFALGGDSLLAAQVVSRIRRVFQVELPLKTIFKDPTLAGQALKITELVMEEIEEITEEDARRFAKKSFN